MKYLQNKISIFSLVYLFLIIICYLHFSVIGDGLFYSWDSSVQYAYADDVLSTGKPFEYGPNYLNSIGNIQHPVGYFLLPEYFFFKNSQ